MTRTITIATMKVTITIMRAMIIRATAIPVIRMPVTAMRDTATALARFMEAPTRSASLLQPF